MKRLPFFLSVVMLVALSACGLLESEPDEPTTRCGPEAETRCAAGETWPGWALEDIQPSSPRFGQTYGLDAFDGKVVLVAFLVGWCPYCRAQTEKLEELQAELAGEGIDVAFVTVHGVSANNADDQLELTSRCTFPIFQDTSDANVWEAMGGAKDDFFVYAPDGTLREQLPPSSGTNLNEPEDYAAMKARLVSAVDGQ